MRGQGDLNQGPTGLRSGVLTFTPRGIAAEQWKILSLWIAESLMLVYPHEQLPATPAAVHVDRHFMSKSDT